VHIGAILTVPTGIRLQHVVSNGNGHASGLSFPSTAPMAHWEILGKSVLDRLRERLQALGVSEIAVIGEQNAGEDQPGSQGAVFWTEWNAVISRYVQFDLATLLLVRVGPYMELDIADFLRFHRETSSAMTQVYDAEGALDVVAIDGKWLAEGTGTFRSRLQTLIPKHKRFLFRGYCNRLADVRDFHGLVTDALLGRAAIRPLGHEIRANVWLGENARIDESARIVAPAYIGRNSRVNGDCLISGACAVEQGSEIGFGTTLDNSCVLPTTYVGPGLRVCGGVVYQQTLFHLARNVQLQFHDRRLLEKAFPPGAFCPTAAPHGTHQARSRCSKSRPSSPRTFAFLCDLDHTSL